MKVSTTNNKYKIKKLFLVLASLAVMASCSSDAEQATTVNESVSAGAYHTKMGPTLEDLYKDMIDSQEYADYQSALKTFSSKVNYSGSMSNVDTESKLLSWISTNISQTGFVSYIDAVNEWTAVKTLGKTMRSEHILFFETLQEDGVGNLELLMPAPSSGPTPDGCPEVCGMEHLACNNAAQAAYQVMVADATASWVSVDVASTNQFNNDLDSAEIFLHLYGETCDHNLVTCCGG